MRKQPVLTIYVEGGGDSRALLLECQQAFRRFFERAGLPKGSFAVYASGSRHAAYEDYCFARANDENALLLVDSEDPVRVDHSTEQPISPWQHLAERAADQWARPASANINEVQLMAPIMEAWFIADAATLAAYYVGKFRREAFNTAALPKRPNVDQLTKAEIESALSNATRPNKNKGLYHKGQHSFDILASIDPVAVAANSYHARRLLCYLKAALRAAATMSWLDCADFIA